MKDFTSQVITKVEMNPPVIIIYGVGGIGKTTLASKFPKPIFVRTEDGAGQISGVGKLPKCETVYDLEEQLDWIARGQHDYKTCVLDSLDAVEVMKNQDICAKAGVQDVLELGFGKGTGPLRAYFDKLRVMLDEVKARGMIVVCIGHSIPALHKDPLGDDYSTYTMNLNDKTVPKMKDWSDVTLFINNKIQTKKAGEHFGKAIVKAVSKAKPTKIMYTEERPGFLAKNRYNLPFEMELYEGDPQQTVNELLGGIKAFLAGANAPKVPLPEDKKPAPTESNNAADHAGAAA